MILQPSFFVCPYIQLHKYACDDSQIWLFLACSSTVNIYEAASYLTKTYLLTVTQIELPRVQFPTTMSDSKSLNTSFLEVIISCKNESVFICDLSDLTLQIIWDAWWAATNVGSKRPVTWNTSGHAPSWRFYLHCGMEETCSPRTICIVCHQVLRHPSEHGTISIAKHLLAKEHIAKLNESIVSEVTGLTSSTVAETVMAMLKRQGSRGITIVSSQRKLKFTIQVLSKLTELTDKTV